MLTPRLSKATTDWALRNPRLTGPQLNAIASSSTRAVAVGLEGHIVSSTDGTNWTTQNAGANRHLMDVIYANARFVAVGALYDDAGTHSLALTSSDGITWTERPTNSRWWKSIAYGNGRFVAVGDHTVDTSPDGITWTHRAPFVYVQFYGVAFGNGIFVAMGVFNDDRGNFYYSVQRSTDGISWDGAPAPASAVLRGITFGNGQFVMVGDGGRVFTSTDGISWTAQGAGTGSTLNDVAFANGMFVAVGGAGTVLRSPDGIQWFQPWDSEPCNLLGCGSAFGRVFGVGERSCILSSTDLQTWTSPVSATYSDLRGITFGQQKYVAVGKEGSGVVSGDGLQWTARPVYQTIGGMPNTWFNAASFGNGSFVSVGGQGAPIFTSRDATSWTNQYWNLGVDELFGMTYGSGRFVSVGASSTGYGVRAGIRTSDSGTTWSSIIPGPQAALRCVANGNGIWVAAGADLLTSSDGLNWTSRSYAPAGTLYAATFGQGRFVLAGDTGGTITSTNGIDWTFNPAFASSQIFGLAFGNNEFMAVGKRGNNGVMWTSWDGATWTQSGTASAPLRAVTYANGSFTAVGDAGLVVQSSSNTTAQLMVSRSATGVQVLCRGEPGRQYRMQISNDGRTWQDLFSFRATTSDPPYRDSGAQGMRLYRLVSP
ncbi:MAG TPA: hypothetical protein VK615_11425 [Candidatus Binatia bacterium]|nr:hypothetical protein [Candidatus Binatia bacterium]